jgi:glycosyltransferase involved in cell wall biosynthesis
MDRATSPAAPPLRVAYVTDALVPFSSGGAERRVHELATRLADRHDVHVVTWSFWGPEPTLVRDGITFHGVGRPRGFYGADGRRTLREGIEFTARLPLALARLEVDVIDVSATPYLPLYGAWFGTRFSRTPIVATWHEFWGAHWADYLPDRPLVARLAVAGESWARSLANRRVAVSPFTAARMADRAPRRGATDIVGNGVDSRAISSARPDTERSDVIFVGRLIDEKRADLLVRAVAGLVGAIPDIKCLIVGDGPERERLAALTAELGVEARVGFTGRVDAARLPRLLRASKVFVLPSAREGYGISVVEAQAGGLVPVVARSPMSAATDLIADGVDGLICEPTPEALAAAIRGLLGDPRRRRRLASAARSSAKAQDWDQRADAMEAIYRDVVAARAARRGSHAAAHRLARTRPQGVPPAVRASQGDQ